MPNNQDNTCIEELAAAERKAYFKEWRAKNKDKTAEHRRRYWEKRALKRRVELPYNTPPNE
jgi:hypothetical protein